MSSRFRFTLSELLAVLAIVGLLLLMAPPLVLKAKASAGLRACQSNLRQIAGNLQLWVEERNHGAWPSERGMAFLQVLTRDGELRGGDVAIFCCPTTLHSFAVRDAVRFPIDTTRLSSEPIASDGNVGRANHPNVTNVVYADGHIQTVDVKDYAKQLPDDAEWVPVGPGSPDPDLQKLLNE